MTLDEYLSAEKARSGLTEAAFGNMVGLSQPQVNRLRRSNSWPSREVLERIARITNNTVTPNDFITMDAPGQPSPAEAPAE